PVTTLIRVDFPAPFSPSKAWMEPGMSERLTPFSALTPGKTFSTLRASNIGLAVMSCASLADGKPGAQAVEPNRRQDQHSEHDLHEEGVDGEENQRLRDDRHDHHAEQRRRDADMTAGEDRTADHGRGE